MNPRTDFKPVSPAVDGLAIGKVEECAPRFYRFLYESVGAPYGWKDRLVWTDERIRAYLRKSSVDLFVALFRGEVAGYLELLKRGHEIKIAYFGLIQKFHGKGIGKYLLAYGIKQALNQKVRRITVSTLTTDGKHALGNYLKRGFQITKRKTLP